MGILKQWKSFLISTRITADEERNASQNSAEFWSVVGQPRQGASDGPASLGSTAAAGGRLTTWLSNFEPRLSMNISGEKLQKKWAGTSADATRKQAWTDIGSMPEILPHDTNSSLGSATFAAKFRDEAADESSMAMAKQEDHLAVVEPRREVRLDTPGDDAVMNCNSTAQQAERQLAASHQQSAMEELEEQWAKSMFASMDHEHQQQLRAVIGLPKQ
eukprot:TRINITY_DN24434_c0_g1_i1.p1 TRINITY_DN24434_c0_g1~~TRINITY_DN24434_c0_g1_i1.p1  ORF type:complete len:217 (+),score=52.64 TRINITY_DN24434_c0_g1_i1:47-697(+)